MKSKIILLAVMVGIFAYACNQPAKEKIQTVKSGVLDTKGAENLKACHHQSKISWKGFKPGGEHYGFVSLKPDGVILIKDNQLVGADITIDLTSITCVDLTDETYNAKLVGHLKSADFFNVDSFPTANFKITGITPIEGDAQFTHLLQGDMTIKAITHPISFKAKVVVNGKSLTAESETFMLDRTKWKVNYGSKSIFKELKDSFINDEFSIQISLATMN